MRLLQFCLPATLLMFASSTVHALDYPVNYSATAPVIDGTVDVLWNSAATEMTGFVSSTAIATASTQQTRVRALWNSDKLFLLYEADDAGIVAPATGSDTGFDFTTPQDAAEIVLDPSWRQGGTGVTNIAYRICVNPAAGAFTYTEAGLTQTAWNLGANSQAAFSSSGTNWKVELSIAWSELNSILTNSPGPVAGPPGNNSKWGAQLLRHHSAGNNASLTKWHPVAGTGLVRPLGTFTFVGAPAATPVALPDLTTVYTTSFEAPTFTVGQTASEIQNWTSSNPGNFLTTNTQALAGTQSLEIIPSPAGGRTILSPAVPPDSTSHVIQYAVKMPSDVGTNQYRHVFYVMGEYADETTKTLTQIWLYGAGTSVGGNTIRVSDFISANEDTATNYFFPGLFTLDDWSYITVRANGTNNTFEVWYNNTKLVYPGTTGVYTTRYKSIFRYMNRATLYNKTFGTLSFYTDSFNHYKLPSVAAAQDWQLLE